MKRLLISLLCLLAMGAALSAPLDRNAALRKHAAPVWRAYTRDHVAEIAGKRQWVRLVYRHDPKSVRYTVRDDKGTVTAPGMACVSAPCSSEAQAKEAPWKMQERRTLALTFVWKSGAWRPGPVEWKDEKSSKRLYP